MKNLWKLLILIILLIVIASSCNMQEFIDPWDFELDFDYKQDAQLHGFLTNYNIKKQDKFNQIRRYANHSKQTAIKYVGDNKNYLPIPQEIINKRKTECQGKSILTIGLIYKYLGIKCNYVEVFLIEKQVSHAIFQYEGKYYSSTGYRQMEDNEMIITKIINFDDFAWYINMDNAF